MILILYSPTAGLLKWRPAGQIRPAAPLKVARGRTDKRKIYRIMTLLFWPNPTHRFAPVSVAYTENDPILKIECFARIFNTF